nr:EamA family transporter [Flavihumibacter stibioxidans]
MGNVFQKQLTESRNHPLLVNFLTYFFLGLACLFFLPAIEWSQLPVGFWWFSIAGGIAGALGNAFLVKALQTGDLSVLGPINAYKSVVGLVVAVFLLGEIPSLWGILGIAMIISGSYFVLDTLEEKFSWALLKRKEIQYRIWAMVLTAIEAVIIKKIIRHSNPEIAFVMWCWFGTLFAFVLMIAYRLRIVKELSSIKPRHLSRYLLLILCIGTMQLTTNYVLDNIPVGYALSLFQLSTIVSILLGYKIFREKDIRKKLLGAVIMISGSVIIILMK